MAVSFQGLQETCVTFKTEGVVETGDIVKMYANGTVKLCDLGDQIVGVVKSARAGYASVQIHGAVTLSYTGNAPGLGWRTVDADDAGGVSLSSTGRNVLIVSVDSAAHTLTMIF